MSGASLAAWLSIDEARVAALVDRGMPRRADGNFDPLAVAKWLEREGLGRRCEFTGTVATLGEVATAFGVSLDTVKKEWRRSGMPGESGRFDLAEIAAWKGLRSRDPGNESLASADRDAQRRRLAADARIKEADAQKRERENQVARGELLVRDKIERALAQLVIQTRNSFQAAPRDMMPRFPKDQAIELADELGKIIERILTNLAKWRPDYGD